MEKFPVLLFDPDSPDSFVVAETPLVLYERYNKGYRKVNLEKVGTAVRKLRRRFKLTSEEFSELLFTRGFVVSPKEVEEYESSKGLHRIGVPLIRLVAELFGIPPRDIVLRRTRVKGLKRPAAAKRVQRIKQFRVDATSTNYLTIVTHVYASDTAEATVIAAAYWRRKYDVSDAKNVTVKEITAEEKGVIWSTAEARTT